MFRCRPDRYTENILYKRRNKGIREKSDIAMEMVFDIIDIIADGWIKDLDYLKENVCV